MMTDSQPYPDKTASHTDLHHWVWSLTAGTTVELVGLSHLGADKEGGALMAFVNREDLLKDIQFR
jgi:hypothetical protein